MSDDWRWKCACGAKLFLTSVQDPERRKELRERWEQYHTKKGCEVTET